MIQALLVKPQPLKRGNPIGTYVAIIKLLPYAKFRVCTN